MKKNYFKIVSLAIGVLLLLLVVVNFALNFWLTNNLPSYIKKNSEYIITYKSLDVDPTTGDILASGITINNQNPDRTDKLGLQGTVDTLEISRLGLYDLIINNKISTENITLINPQLNIILPKPEDKTKNDKNALRFKDIKIRQGNLQVYRHTGQKFLAVDQLNFQVEDLKIAKKSEEQKLPFVFGTYSLSGRDFYYRPDNVYAFKAKEITTEDGQMNVKNFAMIPLLSYQNFRKYFPQKRNMFDLKAAEMKFKNILFEGQNLTLSDITFENPALVMYTTNAQADKKEKSFTYDVQLESVLMNNSTIDIRKPAGDPLFSADNLTMQISRLVMNDETARGNIPFKYEKFNIKGKAVSYYTDLQAIKVANLTVLPKAADLKNISIKPISARNDKTNVDLTANRLNLKINEWDFVENKLKLDVEQILVNQLNGSIKTVENTSKNKLKIEGIHFPLKVKSVVLVNSNLQIDSKNKPLIFKDLQAKIQNIEMNEQTVKEKIPFKTGSYSLTTRNFNYQTEFYNLSASLLKLNKNNLQVSNFAMKPKVSRAQFIRMIPAEKDLYNLKMKQLSAQGKWDLAGENKFIDLENVLMNSVDANIFRSKIPKDDLTEKPMYSKLLRSIKFPLFVKNLDVKNSVLVYEEDTKKSDGPGKLTFNNFNLNAKNINSGKMKGRPTMVPISIRCNFMNASPMNVKWSFDTADMNDAFSISGNVADLPASRINPFIEPYLKIQATGLISDLIFNFNGNKQAIKGTLKMVHQNLKIAILKQTGEKDKLLSAVANVFVKTDSGNFPESVIVEPVERDKTKSFFNLFWRGIEQGLKKTLIGKNAPKTEQSIKNTIGNTKSALEQNKTDLQETKIEVKQKVEDVKGKIQQKKEAVKEKNIFKKIFKKKSEN